MAIKFTPIKDVAFVALDRLVTLSARLPEPLLHAGSTGIGWLLKTAYLVPGSHIRRTAKNVCRVTGHPAPRRMYFRLVDKTVQALRMYDRLRRHGREAVAQRTDIGASDLATFRRVMDDAGGAIFVIPHCASSVLAAARIAGEFPVVALGRDPKSKKRAGIALQYFERLGVETLLVRNMSSVLAARGLLKALRAGKLVFGHADVARRTPDSVEITVFGQRVWLPEWPARFSARCKVPSVAMFPRMEDDRIRVAVCEPYFEPDRTACTQRWMGYFEQQIRADPTDWTFMFDKYWSRVLADAARGPTGEAALHAS